MGTGITRFDSEIAGFRSTISIYLIIAFAMCTTAIPTNHQDHEVSTVPRYAHIPPRIGGTVKSSYGKPWRLWHGNHPATAKLSSD